MSLHIIPVETILRAYALREQAKVNRDIAEDLIVNARKYDAEAAKLESDMRELDAIAYEADKIGGNRGSHER